MMVLSVIKTHIVFPIVRHRSMRLPNGMCIIGFLGNIMIIALPMMGHGTWIRNWKMLDDVPQIQIFGQGEGLLRCASIDLYSFPPGFSVMDFLSFNIVAPVSLVAVC